MKKNKTSKVIFAFAICIIIFASSKIYATENTIFSEQNTVTSHTKKEIVEKMNNIIQYDYSNSEYLVTPSSKAPYAAGSLEQGVIDDTLRRINFFRWLYGINPVYVNTAKMERNQKGAVLLAAIRELTHTPDKPSDMDDDFYNEGYAGCYYGATTGDYYSGNCAVDSSYMPYVIDGYISDIYNVSTEYGAVGHRNSLLDPYAYAVSFGRCGYYSTLSMYYALSVSEYNSLSENSFNYENFFSYPSAGYFPKSLFEPSEYFSVYLFNVYSYPSTMTATFTYNGVEYKATSITKEYREPIVSFQMPSELRDALGTNYEMPECTIDVKVDGYVLNDGTTGTVMYTTTFFDEDKVVQDFTFSKDTITTTVGNSKKIELTASPSTAVIENETFSTKDSDIISVDDEGNVTGLSEGTATVTVNVDGITKAITINVLEHVIGDLDNNGIVNSSDASIALDIYKRGNATEEELKYGDINGDKIINSIDASMILDIYRNGID